MRALVDIVHPAHVHFFKHIITALEARGHETLIAARDKDVTRALLDHYGLPYTSVGHAGAKSRAAQLSELLHRDFALARMARRFKADVILTRNPAGVQAARLVGARGIFDTDDGRAAGIHFRAAAPFAHLITSPDCLDEYYGAKHIKYPGYKQTAYLHPDHFQPDPEVHEQLGVGVAETYFIVRFVNMVASHDRGESGLDLDSKRALIERLQAFGRVFVSSEGTLPDDWRPLAFDIPPHRIHDALAFATLFVGDSQTMAAEAAVLGTPSLWVSTFAGRICYLEELEHVYGLTHVFHPRDTVRFFARLDEWLAAPDLRASLSAAHARMLDAKCNVAMWYRDFLESRT